jgi:MSHA biogenesis protein MshQ
MLKRMLLLMAVIWMTTTAYAATYSLPSALGSGPFANCIQVTTTYYRCSGNVLLGNSDTLTITSPLIIEVTGSFSVGNDLTITGGGNGFQIYALGNISIGTNISGAANLRAGGSVSIDNNGALTGNIIATGVLTLNTATVTGTCSPANAQCSGGVALSPALTFTKTASTSSVSAGSPVSFTVLVRNDGSAGAATLRGVTVTDVFPCSGLTRGTPTASQGSVTPGTCSGGSETLIWNADSIAPGASATLTIPATGTTPGSWVNTVSLTSPSILTPPPTQNAIVTVNAPTINQVKMEVGDLTVIDTYTNPVWTQVNFTQVFDRTPYVFTLPTNNGGDSGAHRIRNVTTTGFQVTTVEPGRLDGRDGEDGPHVAMGLSYLAIDSCPGGTAQCTLTLSNGDKWQLGFVNTSRAQAYGTDKTTSTNWEKVNFTPAFSTPPAVLVQVQTLNNEIGILNATGTNCATINSGRGPCPSTPWLTSAVNGVTAAQMDVALERSEARWGSMTQSEVIAYVAAAPTAGRVQFLDGAGNVVKYEIIRTPAQYRGWDNGFVTQSFSSTWAPDVPKVIASMNSRNNLETVGNNTTGDGGWLRRQVETTVNQQIRVNMTVDEVRTGTFNTDGDRTKNNSEIAGIFAFNRGFAIDPVKLNQIRIVHDGAAQSCVDETIIVKACGDAACNASTLYTGPVTSNLQPNNASASWTGTGVVGSTLNFSGGSGAANLRYSAAGTITLGLTATPTPANGVACYSPAGVATSCTMTVTACASQLINACEGASCNCTSSSCAANYDRLYTKLRGNALSFGLVGLTQVSGQYVLDTGFSGTVLVDLVANQGAGACPTPTSVIGLPSSSQNLTFSAGRPVSSGVYSYSAANNLTPYRNLRLRFTRGTPAASTCSLDNFSIRPQGFTVTSSNATNNQATGTPVFKAGADNFNLTATAVAGYDGTPQIDSAQLVGTPTAGTITGSFAAATIANGIANGNTFTYSEAGNLGLSANAIYDDSWSAVDQPGDCTNDASNLLVGGKYGCKIGSTAVTQTTGSSGFGRFIPNHFVLSGNSVSQASGTFSYMDQPFGINFTLTAVNVAAGTTRNYAGSYAKLDPATAALWPSTTLGATGLALGAANGGVDLSTRLSVVGSPTGTWVNGGTTVAANLKFSRPISLSADATWGPYNALDLGIAPQDSDGIKLLPAALNLDASSPAGVERQKINAAPTLQRFGRIRMPNVYGSERLPLPMTSTVQYYNGANWVTSTTDSFTAFNTNLSTAGGNLVTNVITGLGSGVIVTSPGSAAVVAGVRIITLSAPGVSGSVDLSLNAPSYLSNTAARATFGIYKSPLIYRRENY